MPRKLPWMSEATASKGRRDPSSAAKRASATAISPAAATSTKRQRTDDNRNPADNDASSDDGDLVDANLNSLQKPNPSFHSPTPKPRNPLRDPSTSPPLPSAADNPSEEANQPTELMRPTDDKYLMVEDEFLTTAKQYTQHIHRAEYLRLKSLARSRGAKTLQDLSHGTHGGKTEQSAGVRLKLEGLEGRRRMEKELEELVGPDEGDDSEDDPFMRDPQLAGLMSREEGNERKRRDLSGVLLGKGKSRSRAAAGFEQSPKNVGGRKRDALKDREGDRAVRGQMSDKLSRVFEEKEEALGRDDDDEDNDDDPGNIRQPSRMPGLPMIERAKHARRDHDGSGHRVGSPRAERGSKIFKHFAKTESPEGHLRSKESLRAGRNSNDLEPPAAKHRSTSASISQKDEHRSHEWRAPSSPSVGSRTSRQLHDGEDNADPSEDWLERRHARSTTADYIAKRRAAREKQSRHDEKSKKTETKITTSSSTTTTTTKKRADDIPTFIF